MKMEAVQETTVLDMDATKWLKNCNSANNLAASY